jgi:hypothetical protein
MEAAMPKFLENRLRAEAARKGFSGKRADRYVYGAMNNMGAMRGSKETAKGAAMEKKHQREHGGAEHRGEQPNPSTHTPPHLGGHPTEHALKHAKGRWS